MMTIKFAKTLTTAAAKTTDTVIIPVTQALKIGGIAKDIDSKSKGALKRALKVNEAFKGKNGQTLQVILPSGHKFDRAVFIGLGEDKSLDALAAEKAGGTLYAAIKSLKPTHMALSETTLAKAAKIDGATLAAHILNGFEMRSYTFLDYKAKQKKEAAKTGIKSLTYLGDDSAAAKKAFKQLQIVTHAAFTARDLVNEPPNTLYPDSYAKRIAKLLRPLSVNN